MEAIGEMEKWNDFGSSVNDEWGFKITPPIRKDGRTDLYPLMITMASDGSEGTDDAKNKTKIVESFLGPGMINAISKGLSTAGLGCKLNTYGNILQYTTDIVTSLPDGTFFFLSQGEKVFDADFTFRDPFGLQDRLAELLSDANIQLLQSHYSLCIEQEEKNSVKSSSIEEIIETLKQIGHIIGTLSVGARINPGEIAMVLQQIFANLCQPRGTTYEKEINNVLCIVEPNPEDLTTFKRIGMIKFSISYSLEDVTSWFGKKTIECKYKMKQTSVIFGSSHTLRNVYERVFNM